MCGVKPARRPELAAEVKYLTWTGDNLLRQVVYERLREDKPAAEVRREVPIGKPDGAVGHSGNAQSSNEKLRSLRALSANAEQLRAEKEGS
jgi:hypothetical protein